MSRSPVTDANRGATGQQTGQRQQQGGQQQGGQNSGGQSQGKSGGQSSSAEGDEADEGDEAGDESDDDKPDGDESESDESSNETLDDLKRRLKKSEKERRRLKRKLQTASGQPSGQQAGQQQGGQQQGASDQSQAEVLKLKQTLLDRDARDNFLDAVLDDSAKNKHRVIGRKQAVRAWKAIKEDAEIGDDGEIENLDDLLDDLHKDMPGIFMKGKSKSKVSTSGDGGIGSQVTRKPATDMNAGIRDMYHRKQGRG
jgi:hypothetical protein